MNTAVCKRVGLALATMKLHSAARCKQNMRVLHTLFTAATAATSLGALMVSEERAAAVPDAAAPLDLLGDESSGALELLASFPGRCGNI